MGQIESHSLRHSSKSPIYGLGIYFSIYACDMQSRGAVGNKPARAVSDEKAPCISGTSGNLAARTVRTEQFPNPDNRSRRQEQRSALCRPPHNKMCLHQGIAHQFGRILAAPYASWCEALPNSR
jgi:hypothetical protein